MLENWEALPPPATGTDWTAEDARKRLDRARGLRLLTRAESNRLIVREWETKHAYIDMDAALDALKAARSRAEAAEQERDKARAWAKRWKRVAKIWKNWGVGCALTSNYLSRQGVRYQKERDAARARLTEAEAVIAWYAELDNWRKPQIHSYDWEWGREYEPTYPEAYDDEGERARAYQQRHPATGEATSWMSESKPYPTSCTRCTR